MFVKLYGNSMGQSLVTPLSVLVGRFKEVKTRAHNLNVRVKKKKFVTLCQSEWPIFNVGWPAEGTFDLSLIRRMKEVIFKSGRDGHPDQILYILM